MTITYLRGGTGDVGDTIDVPRNLMPRLRELYAADDVDPLGLLPAQFTLTDAYRLHKAIRGAAVPQRDAFRRWAEALLIPVGQVVRDGTVGRPAALFQVAVAA